MSNVAAAFTAAIATEIQDKKYWWADGAGVFVRESFVLLDSSLASLDGETLMTLPTLQEQS